MLDLLLLMMIEPPAVQLRGEAPAVVDWPEGYPALRGEDARALARALDVADNETIISAEPAIGHYGQMYAVEFRRPSTPTESPLLCSVNWTAVSIRGTDSPDYPGWVDPEELARLRAEGRLADPNAVFSFLPLEAGESCETADPTGRIARTFSPEYLEEAIGVLNRLRREVAWGEVATPPCVHAFNCPDPEAGFRLLSPGRVRDARPSTGRPGCWWIAFQRDLPRDQGLIITGGSEWVVTACENLGESNFHLAPAL